LSDDVLKEGFRRKTRGKVEEQNEKKEFHRKA
jgi:hypothetical protein